MDAILLTWRWQNIFAIWIIAGFLYLAVTAVQQVAMRAEGGKAANG